MLYTIYNVRMVRMSKCGRPICLVDQLYVYTIDQTNSFPVVVFCFPVVLCCFGAHSDIS